MNEVDHYLYRLVAVRKDMLAAGLTNEEEAVIDAHAGYLNNLTRQGMVVFAGRTLVSGPDSFGVVVLRAADEATAQQVMDDDPAVTGNVLRAELFPFRIACLGERLES